MSAGYSCEQLAPHHSLEAFACGEISIDNWCRGGGGRKAHDSWLCTVWVLTTGSSDVAGLFTLSNHTVEGVLLPSRDAGGVATSPAILIGKLAMREDLRGRKIGSLLIGHAIEKAVDAARLSASRLITLDATNERVMQWYQNHDFKSYSSDTPLKMYMKMSSAVRFADELKS